MRDKLSNITYQLAKKYTDEHGGGGGGTTNYNALTNKPQVNGVELKGSLTSASLNIKENVQADWEESDTTAESYINNKPDVIEKSATSGLIKNDGTVDTTEYAEASVVEGILDGTSLASFGDVETALEEKVDVVSGKGLSTNDFTDAYEDKLDDLANIKSIGSGLSLNTTTGELTATGISITIDTEIDDTSTNPVQNKVIAEALDDKADATDVPTALSDLTDDATHRLVTDTEKTTWNGKADVSDIPDSLDDLADDEYHRTVTDAEKSTWNGKADVSAIPTTTSELTNDSGFITNTVNNLTNYYLSSQTYSKSEVDSLISAITTLDIEVVQTLPTQDISQTTIYLVPKSTAQTSNTYDEYINTTGTSAGWELIGDTSVDLTNYIQKSQTAGLVKNDGTIDTVAKASQSSVDAILDGTDIDSFGDVETALAGKQDTLTFDHTPKDNSLNPVRSDGIYDSFIGVYDYMDEVIGWNGKNILPVNDGTVSVYGITAVSSDGVVTLNGTATQPMLIELASFNSDDLKAYGEKLFMTGAYSNTAFLTFYKPDWTYTKDDKGNGVEIDPSELDTNTEYKVIMQIANGTTLTNAKMYPMIRLASNVDPSFSPNHANVKDSLDEKADKVSTATNGNLASLNATGNLTDSGKSASKVPTVFTGTSTEWNALSTAEKKGYEICNITDDVDPAVVYTKTETDVLLAEKTDKTQITNPNLLDNPWFTVNQRGFTTDTTATKLYTVDRWYINNSKATFSNGIMEIELGAGGGSVRPRFAQVTEHSIKVGQRYTLTFIAKISVESGYNAPSIALIKSDGSYDGSKYGLLNLHDTGNNYETFSYSFAPTEDIDNLGVTIIAPITTAVKQSTVSIKAVKLELGSVSTLAMDTAPNYATELLKCQRYFVRFKASSTNISVITGFAIVNGTARFSFNLPVDMMAYPTISYSALADWGASNTNAAGALVPTSIARQGALSNRVIIIDLLNTGITVSTPYILYALSADAYIDFSADL